MENGIVNGEVYGNEELKRKCFKVEGVQFWVLRIQLLFVVEDLINFVERVVKVYVLRCEIEVLFRYNLYVDCMFMDGVVRFDFSLLERMIIWVKGIRILKSDKRYLIDFFLFRLVISNDNSFFLELLLFG